MITAIKNEKLFQVPLRFSGRLGELERPKSCFRWLDLFSSLRVSEKRGPQYSTPNSRTLVYKDPKIRYP